VLCHALCAVQGRGSRRTWPVAASWTIGPFQVLCSTSSLSYRDLPAAGDAAEKARIPQRGPVHGGSQVQVRLESTQTPLSEQSVAVVHEAVDTAAGSVLARDVLGKRVQSSERQSAGSIIGNCPCGVCSVHGLSTSPRNPFS
jgi:hypothetical protein